MSKGAQESLWLWDLSSKMHVVLFFIFWLNVIMFISIEEKKYTGIDMKSAFFASLSA